MDIREQIIDLINRRRPKTQIYDNQDYIDYLKNLNLDFDIYDYNLLRAYLLGYLNKCAYCGKYCVKKFCSSVCSNKSRTKEKEPKVYLSQEEKTRRALQGKIDKYGYLYNNSEKANKTKLEKYGTLDFSDKIKNTVKEKYNIDNIFQLSETKEKSKQTKLEKYNDINYNNQEKHQQTCLERYNVNHQSQRHITNIENLNSEFVLENFTDLKFYDYNKFKEYFNLDKSAELKYRGLFGITKPIKPYYKSELNLINKILELKPNNQHINIIHKDRNLINPLELDIVLPDIKLAIEYDGLMYHSQGSDRYSKFKNIDKNYHLNKTELCLEKGYTLFHIFESDNIDIWLSMIKNKLNLIPVNNKIYARKCIIKEIKSSETIEFLNLNHLQGYCNASINLGLYYNNELVSLMTFAKPRFNKKYDYELIRFCNKSGFSVIGGASKLFNYFIKNYNTKSPKSIISYANRRFSNGKIYETLGFKFLRKTEPNYFYFKKNTLTLLSRNQFQKHKLKDKLSLFDYNLSESENMFNNDYRRIYDCGNLVYEYTNNEI